MQLRRRVGYVADAPGMYEWMSVAQAGWYASGFYADGFLTRYAQLCADFSLPADTAIRSLSKGMRAKVALALAMAFDPELLILDEPTSGLIRWSDVLFWRAWSTALLVAKRVSQQSPDPRSRTRG